MGKGSTRRPSSVPPAVEADNWARTFGGNPQHDLDHQREMRAEAVRLVAQYVEEGMQPLTPQEARARVADWRPFDSAAQ